MRSAPATAGVVSPSTTGEVAGTRRFDLANAQWAAVDPLLPKAKRWVGRRCRHGKRRTRCFAVGSETACGVEGRLVVHLLR